jgi:hypothetical protein
MIWQWLHVDPGIFPESSGTTDAPRKPSGDLLVFYQAFSTSAMEAM